MVKLSRNDSRMIYPKAPITEAVLDIRFESGFDAIASADRICEIFADRLPHRAEIQSQTLKFGVGKNTSFSHSQKPEGWRFESESRDRVLQVRDRGFSYSHLKPYSNWTQFKKEARSLFDSFNEAVPNTSVKGLGLRYINRIDIPSDAVKVDEYFSMYPHLNDEIIEKVTGLFMQVRTPLSEFEGCVGLINMALMPPDNPNTTSVLLDFDISFEGAFDDQSLWSVFDKMRDAKNRLFESSITDRTRELFK